MEITRKTLFFEDESIFPLRRALPSCVCVIASGEELQSSGNSLSPLTPRSTQVQGPRGCDVVSWASLAHEDFNPESHMGPAVLGQDHTMDYMERAAPLTLACAALWFPHSCHHYRTHRRHQWSPHQCPISSLWQPSCPVLCWTHHSALCQPCDAGTGLVAYPPQDQAAASRASWILDPCCIFLSSLASCNPSCQPRPCPPPSSMCSHLFCL